MTRPRLRLAATLLACLLPGPIALDQMALAAGGEDVNTGIPTSTLDLAFELYAGGIPLGKAAMQARIQGEDYKAISTVETSGIVNAFWQSKIEAASSGLVGQGRVQPGLYDSFSQNRQSPRRHATLSFDPEGPKSFQSDPPYADNRYPVPNELQKRTLDPLSAVVYLTASNAATDAKPCEARAPIFDGRRRYDVSFSFVRKTNVRMDNGLYSGPAFICQVHYTQLAGYQQSVIEDNKKFPKLFAWVVSSKGTADPNRTFMLPIRVWAETEFGIVVALASQVRLDSQSLAKGG